MNLLVDASGVPDVPPIKPPVDLPLLTVVCPRHYATLATELTIRRTAAGLLRWQIEEHGKNGLWLPYARVLADRKLLDNFRDWQYVSTLCIVAWHFRGAREDMSVVLAETLISRIETGATTIVTCSADPLMLSPRWPTDRPAVDALKKANLYVRVEGKQAQAERR